MPSMQKFPSIEQFRNTVKYVRMRARWSGKDEAGEDIYDPAKPIPVLDFIGTVKLHGSNAAVCQSNGERWFQSRERFLTVSDDNYGFAQWATNNSTLFDKAFSVLSLDETVCIYGEWCGQGIQKGVGISALPKIFIVFAVRLINGDDAQWMSGEKIKSLELMSIYDFPTFSLRIDFNNSELSQNWLVQFTENVEKECPVARQLGASGIGEGIVWTCISDGWETSQMWFKVKGEKHSVTKVRTLAEVDIEKISSVRECVEIIVTENRLRQGLEYLQEMKLNLDIKNMSAFLKWVASDAIKEEADTIAASGLEPKDVGKQISMVAKTWLIAELNRLAMEE